MTHNFCESCNRVRVTCTGRLYLCLGQEDSANLREPLRASEANERLNAAIDDAIARKPKGHDFVIGRDSKPSVYRDEAIRVGRYISTVARPSFALPLSACLASLNAAHAGTRSQAGSLT